MLFVRRLALKRRGILLEPVQGEGGVRVMGRAFIQAMREIANEHNILLLFDEVQTGIGRTGYFYGYEKYGVEPDILASAKGLGGGFPIGACLAMERAASGMTAGSHGSTFGGNPLAMAVGNAVLDVVLEDGFLQDVRDKSLLIKQKLASVGDEFPDFIEEIRCEGFLIGLKVRPAQGEVIGALIAEGLLTAPAGDNVVRLLPPLNVSTTEIDEAIDIIRRAAAGMKSGEPATTLN